MAKILFLDDVRFVRKNIDAIRNIISCENATVIPLSDAVFLFLKKEDVVCENYHKYEDEDMYKDVYPVARDWGARWYIQGGKDISETGSYSFGNIVEWSMTYFLSFVLRPYVTVSAVIKKLPPSEIIVITSEDEIDVTKDFSVDPSMDIGLLPRIVKECAAICEASPEVRSIKLPYHANGMGKPRLLGFVKWSCLRVNSILTWIRRLSGRAGGNKKIMFFEGFRHFDTIMNDPQLNCFEKVHLQKTLGLSLYFRLLKRNIIIESIQGNRGPGGKSKVKFDLVAVENKISNFFIFRGKNMFSILEPKLKFLFKELFPNVMYPDLMAVIRAVDRVAPNCVVTENDMTYYEKMLVIAAKRAKIPTVVVQNGTTLCGDAFKNDQFVIHDFFPLTCDKFFTYGKASSDWFENMKVDPEKVLITGASRFDVYYKNANTRVPRERKKTVLILFNELWNVEGVVTHHMGLNVCHEHARECIKLANRHPEIDFVLRPHNSEHLWNEILGKEIKLASNFVVSRDGALCDVLPGVDLAVGYVSTALIEALICRVPVISLDMKGCNNFLHLWEYGLSRRACSFEQLDLEMMKLLYDENERKAALGSIDKNVHVLNYNDDGRASHRIAKQLAVVTAG